MGPRFRGVKMLPPGLHHVAYSAPAAHGPAFAPTASFFFSAAGRGVTVRRWDPATELLLELPDPDEVCPGLTGAQRRPCAVLWCDAFWFSVSQRKQRRSTSRTWCDVCQKHVAAHKHEPQPALSVTSASWSTELWP